MIIASDSLGDGGWNRYHGPTSCRFWRSLLSRFSPRTCADWHPNAFGGLLCRGPYVPSLEIWAPDVWDAGKRGRRVLSYVAGRLSWGTEPIRKSLLGQWRCKSVLRLCGWRFAFFPSKPSLDDCDHDHGPRHHHGHDHGPPRHHEMVVLNGTNVYVYMYIYIHIFTNNHFFDP